MNARIVWRVMWKEYRALRGLWIAVAAASWMAQLAVFALSRDLNWFSVAWGAALVTPVFYALGAAAATFAGEREEGADRFLLALPVDAAPLVTGKMLFLLASTLAIVPAVALTAAASPWLPQAELFDEDLQIIWAPAVLEVIAWGLLFSLLGRSVMQAACLGGLAAAGSVSIALLLTNKMVDRVDPEQYGNALVARLAIVGIVLLVDLALARQWLRGSVERDRSQLRGWLLALPAMFGEALRRFARPLRWQGRLAWLAIRQSSGRLALAVAVPIALDMLLPLRNVATPEFMGLLVGCAVFAGDQRQRSYRCLAEQGAGAGSTWLNRQMVGLAALGMGIVIWQLVSTSIGPLASQRLGPPVNRAWQGTNADRIVLVAIAYGLGQALSLFFHSNIVGTLVAIVGIFPFFFWFVLMGSLALPMAYTVWPLVIGLFAASAVFAPRWLLDRRGPVTWLRVGGTFGLFAGGVLAIVPELRLHGIDDVELNFDRAAFETTLDAEAQSTALLYHAALAALRPYSPALSLENPDRYLFEERAAEVRASQFARLKKGNVSAEDRAWLSANTRTVKMVLEANEKPTCAFLPAGASFDDLLNLLLLRGVAADDRLDGAQNAIGDALRMIRHIRPDQRPADALERRTLEFVLAWANWPEQTPERLASVQRTLVDYGAELPDPAELMKLHYLDLLSSIDKGNANYHFEFERWALAAPWERTRAKRLLNRWINDNLLIVETALDHMRAGSNLLWMEGFRSRTRPDPQFESTPYLAHSVVDGQLWGYQVAETAAQRESRRRATQVILALAAEQLRTGKRPEALVELSRDDRPLPKDPFTALDFHYYPHGFPVLLEPNVQLGVAERLTLATPLPILWSPGLAVQVSAVETDGRLEEGFKVENARGEFQAVENDAEAFVRGFTYPIPMAMPNEADDSAGTEQNP